MNLTTYFLYLAAVALLVCSPGPTMLMCMTTSLNHGPRPALMSAAGSVSAVLGVMLLSALGLGALLAASETAFTVVKVAGAAYLIWLGVRTFRSESGELQVGEKTAMPADAGAPRTRQSFFLRGFLVGASNPKALLFFAAFFPQFLDPAAPFAPQFAVLAATFVACEFTVLTLCAMGVARMAPLLRSSRAVRWINRLSGGLFTAMGGLLLLMRRQA
ncbi:MAG: LysE family translocator [Polaromonas sp.]|nr:LysE family translocator [Polaromonas sp.]